jgi:hypothetical protein
MRKLVLLGVLALTGFIYPATSYAVCTREGTLVRTTIRADGAGTTHTLWLRVNKLADHYYRATTTDKQIAMAASTAVALQTHVKLSGDRTTCQFGGTDRYMGSVRYLVFNP